MNPLGPFSDLCWAVVLHVPFGEASSTSEPSGKRQNTVPKGSRRAEKRSTVFPKLVAEHCLMVWGYFLELAFVRGSKFAREKGPPNHFRAMESPLVLDRCPKVEHWQDDDQCRQVLARFGPKPARCSPTSADVGWGCAAPSLRMRASYVRASPDRIRPSIGAGLRALQRASQENAVTRKLGSVSGRSVAVDVAVVCGAFVVVPCKDRTFARACGTQTARMATRQSKSPPSFVADECIA